MSETSTERSALRSRPSQDDHSHGSSWSRPGSFAMIGVVYIVAIGAAIGACFGFNVSLDFNQSLSPSLRIPAHCGQLEATAQQLWYCTTDCWGPNLV